MLAYEKQNMREMTEGRSRQESTESERAPDGVLAGQSI